MRALKVVDTNGLDVGPGSQLPPPAAAPDAAGAAAADALLGRLGELVNQLQTELSDLRRPAAAAPPPFIITRSDHRYQLIDVGEIELIQADGNYVRLRVGQQWYRHRAAIGVVEKKLGTRRFARVHRSSIVNLGAVRCIAAWFSGDYVIELKSGMRVKMSRTYWQQLTRRFGLD